ncbi:MAG TPA: hypothetical protein VE685_02635 [Thermoanaerobaculia bacterium]|nr:hypothetical protein [Thermoanaerobaculia bacterium]
MKHRIDSYHVKQGQKILDQRREMIWDGASQMVVPVLGQPDLIQCSVASTSEEDYFTFSDDPVEPTHWGTFFRTSEGLEGLVGIISRMSGLMDNDVGVFLATQQGVYPDSDQP